MSHNKPVRFIYTFNASEDYIPEIRRQVSDVCREVGFDLKISMAIQMAIEEACSNVIRHAYMLGKGIIRLAISLEQKQIVFTIIDQGKGFEFDKKEIPNLERYIETGRKGGLGLYLISKIMDEVDYGPVGDENHFRMVRYIGRSREKRKRKGASSKTGLSFKTKFSLTAAACLVLILGAIFAFMNYRITVDTRQELFSETLNSAEGLAARLADKMMLGDELQLAALVKNAAETFVHVSSLTVIDTSGVIWADAYDQRLLLTRYQYPSGISPRIMRQYQSYRGTANSEMHLILVPVEYFGIRKGTLVTAIPENAIESSIKGKQESLIVISLSGLAVAFLIIYLVAIYHGRSVSVLSQSISRIGKDGSPLHGIRVEGKDEISEIARAFNEMTERFKDHHKEAHEEERLKLEMATAEAIQQTLLPKHFPDMHGFEIAADYRPTKNVSGDYFDFVKVDNKHLGIVIADVSGGGIPGSLVMSMLRASIRLEARGELSPVTVLNRVNDFVKEDVLKGMFITVFYMILDVQKRTVKFASAGHNPMILYRQSENDCFLFNPPGLPMGMLLPEGIGFSGKLESDEIPLRQDDLLLIYTDGITESRNQKGEFFGEEGLVNFTRENGSLSPKEFIAKLGKELDNFMEGVLSADDITLVVIKESALIDAVYHRNHVGYRQSKEIRRLVNENPELDLDGIYSRLKEVSGGNGIGLSEVRKELKRLRLDNKRGRIGFSLRRGGESAGDQGTSVDKRDTDGADQAQAPEIVNPQRREAPDYQEARSKPIMSDNDKVDLIENQMLIDFLHGLIRFSSDREAVTLASSLVEKLKKLSLSRRIDIQ